MGVADTPRTADAGRDNASLLKTAVAQPRNRTGYRVRYAQEVQSDVQSVPVAESWGFLPALTLVMSAGLLLVAIADTGARASAPWAEPLFWTGLVVIFAPIAMRLMSSAISAREAVGLVIVLSLGTYLVKILYSPLAFILHDEFLHWRTAIDITTTGHLFTPNSLLPVSAMFPGLEVITTALSSTTGLSFFGAGIVVVGVGRLVLMLSLFMLYRHVSKSAQVAAIACLIYMTNPNFLMFDAAFSYESLAISFAALLLFAMVRRQGATDVSRWGLTGMSVLVLGALTMTHHITSYAVAGFLALWVLTDYYRGQEAKDKPGPGGIAPLAVVLCLVWLVLVARATIGYLAPDLVGAFTELNALLSPDPGTAEAPRQLFQATGAGYVTPIWERVVAFASVGLLLLGIPYGLWRIWVRRGRDSAITFAFAATSALYPVSLIFRFTSAGWEASNRSSEFLFMGLGFVVALGLGELWQKQRRTWKLPLVLAACASVVFLGGFVAGWPPEWRLPGPYLIISTTAGGARSIEEKGISAAEWARSYLGPGNNVGTDDSNMLLMGTYGDQNIETTLSGGINALWILYTPELQPDQLALLRKGQVQYMVVDYRLTTAPSVTRNYFPDDNLGQALRKFDAIPGVSRVFDDGDIVIYNVEALSNAK